MPGGSTIRDGAFVGRRRHLHAADVRQHRRVRRRRLAGRFARARRLVRAGRRARAPQRGRADRRRHRAGRRACRSSSKTTCWSAATPGSTRARSIKQRAVIAAGTVLTGSTPVYDLPNGRIIKPEPGQPLVCPEGAVVVPGARAVTGRHGPGVGPVARDAGDREVPRRPDRHPDGARSVDSLTSSRLTRDAHRHRFDDRAARPRRARCSRGTSKGSAATVHAQPVAGGSLQRHRHRSDDAGRRLLHPLRLRAAVLPEPGRVAGGARGRPCSTAAAPATPRACSRRRSPRRSGCGPTGETRVGLLFVVGEERGSDGAKAANAAGARIAVPDQRRADRQPAGRGHARRAIASGCGPSAARRTPASPSWASRRSTSWSTRSWRCVPCDWPEDPALGTTYYSVGSSRAAWRPNVISPDAEAEVMFRTSAATRTCAALIVTPPDRWSCRARTCSRCRRCALTTVPGFDTDGLRLHDRHSVPRSAGARRCCSGPGSVTLAHTADEYCEIAELERAVDLYAQIAGQLLQS